MGQLGSGDSGMEVKWGSGYGGEVRVRVWR